MFTIIIKIIAKQAPKGQFLAVKNDCSIIFPIIITFAPPNKSGTIKLPKLGMNTNMEPPRIPGNERGKVIFRNVIKLFPPKSLEA